ncbi:TAXI family TRAP transporter solute-binding subunit [Trichothermofontia sp.]
MQNRLILLILLLSLGASGVFTWQWLRDRQRVHTVVLATGGEEGEYYAFGQALAQVVARHQPQLQIQVKATEGSLQNQQLLEARQVDLAILQSDTLVSPKTEAIALLFPEVFHLIARRPSQIQSVSDLRGKRIALMPKGSGSYRLFWPLSQHYGLAETDFVAMPMPSDAAYAALEQGRVDALFRVIALGNASVKSVLADQQMQLVPIEQAAALQLVLPALEPAQIPKGTYNGAIPIPATDLPTVAVRAMLVTRQDVDTRLVHDITRILFEARNDLVEYRPLAAHVRRPDPARELGIPFHAGAQAFYNREEPNFWVTYAEPIGVLVSLVVLCISSLWQFRIWLQGRQKNRADSYNLEILHLLETIPTLNHAEELEQVQRQLLQMFAKVVVDLDRDRISPESFQSFTFPWEVAVTTLRHRETLLRNQARSQE